MPWYKKDIDRGQANKLLIKDGRDGTFLVRPSRVRFTCVFLNNTGESGSGQERS